MFLGRVPSYTEVFGGDLITGNNSHSVSTTFRGDLLLWRTIDMVWEERILLVKDLWKGGDAGSQF